MSLSLSIDRIIYELVVTVTVAAAAAVVATTAAEESKMKCYEWLTEKKKNWDREEEKTTIIPILEMRTGLPLWCKEMCFSHTFSTPMPLRTKEIHYKSNSNFSSSYFRNWFQMDKIVALASPLPRDCCSFHPVNCRSFVNCLLTLFKIEIFLCM